MDYEQQISNINNEILEVKKEIKKVNEKTTNTLITKNTQLWREVIKDESRIIIAISNIKLTVDKLSIENPDKKSINNILGSYINLMKHSNMIRVGWSSLNWRINKIYDKNTTIHEIILLLKEIVFVLSQITKPILIIGEENKIQSLMEQGKQIELTLSNINNDAYELVNIIETKNLNNINNITIEKLDIIEQLVKIKEDKTNYISLFITILKKNLLLIINTKMLISEIVLFTQKIVENTKQQYIETAFRSNQESKNRNDKWITKLKEVEDFIIENNKRPSKHDKNNEVKIHGVWICDQLVNYKKRKDIMSDTTIRKLWEDFINDDKYKEYFISNNEEVWELNLEWVKKYINENKKRPTRRNKDEKKYGVWLTLQLQNYKNKKEIMSNETIRHLWKDFISEYKTYFK
jgi:hypothetical protein